MQFFISLKSVLLFITAPGRGITFKKHLGMVRWKKNAANASKEYLQDAGRFLRL
jgi:hypothetical protein